MPLYAAGPVEEVPLLWPPPQSKGSTTIDARGRGCRTEYVATMFMIGQVAERMWTVDLKREQTLSCWKRGCTLK
jgi:hypothetical protein